MRTLRPRLADALVAALLALVLLAGLGAFPLFDVDEGAFSEATREMLASGDFGSTTLNGALRFDKPILVYWLQAASVAAFGLHDWAFRLPSALCSLVWCGALWGFLQPRLGAAPARLAALMLGTSLGVLVIGRAATADALLNMLLALALFDVWRVLERSPESPLHRVALARACLWVALGLLTKGPVAALVPGAVSLLGALACGRMGTWWRALRWLPGWALLLAVAAPWYVYILQRHGMEFVDGFLLRHNLSRYTSPLEGHSGGFAYYLVLGPVLWLPWSGLLPAVLAGMRRHWQHALGRYLWLWTGFVLAFFSLSGTKLPHYLLYGSTPVFVGLAWVAAGPQPPARWARAFGYGVTAAVIALLAFVPDLLREAAPSTPDPLYRALLAGAGDLAWPWHRTALLAALAIWLGSCLWRPQRPREAAGAEQAFTSRWALGGLLFAGLMVAVVGPLLGNVLQGPYRRAAEVARAELEAEQRAGRTPMLPTDPLLNAAGPDDGRVVQWSVTQPSFAVYLQAITPRRPPAAGQLALTRRDRLDAAGCPGCTVLFEERGVVLLRYGSNGSSTP